MLGTIGFLGAAFAVGLFVYSYKKAYPHVVPRIAVPFVSAYTVLIFVMLLLAASFHLVGANNAGLDTVILIVDAMMFVSTALFLSVIVPWFQRPLGIALVTFVVGTLLALRATVYLPTAYIENGIMHFGLEGEPRVILLAALLFIWLPATVIAAKHALESIRLPHLRQPFALAYLTLVLFSAAFFAARQEVMVIATFLMMIVLFAALGVANILVHRLKTMPAHKEHHGRK